MKWVIRFEEYFIAIALILMSALAFVQVITRYVLELPNAWIEETARYLMVWLIFIGMAIAARKRAHLDVQVVSFFFPSVAGKVLLFYQIVMLAFGVVFTYLTCKVMTFQFELGQVSPGMQLPMGWVYLGMLLGGILFVSHLASFVYKEFRGIEHDEQKGAF